MGNIPAKRNYRTWISDSERWQAYEPRNDDVIIATYPKSGTTWMQQIVSLLIFQDAETRPIGEISAWLDFRLGPELDEQIKQLETQTHRRFLKSHIPCDGAPFYNEVKYIHVARDGRDTCLSYHNHCMHFSSPVLQRLNEIGLADPLLLAPFPTVSSDPRTFFRHWLTEGVGQESNGIPFYSWFNFEITYWTVRHQPNVLYVHYRDLKNDLEREMRRVAAFLEIDVREELWPELVKAATFDEMRRHGAALHPMVERVFEGGAASFFNKGENNRWQGVLGQQELDAYQARFEEYLPTECREWLENGGQVPEARLSSH